MLVSQDASKPATVLQNKGSATAEQAEAIELLQKQLKDSQNRQKHAEDESISLMAEVAQLRGKLATQTQDLALQVLHKNAGADPTISHNGDKSNAQQHREP